MKRNPSLHAKLADELSKMNAQCDSIRAKCMETLNQTKKNRRMLDRLALVLGIAALLGGGIVFTIFLVMVSNL